MLWTFIRLPVSLATEAPPPRGAPATQMAPWWSVYILFAYRDLRVLSLSQQTSASELQVPAITAGVLLPISRHTVHRFTISWSSHFCLVNAFNILMDSEVLENKHGKGLVLLVFKGICVFAFKWSRMCFNEVKMVVYSKKGFVGRYWFFNCVSCLKIAAEWHSLYNSWLQTREIINLIDIQTALYQGDRDLQEREMGGRERKRESHIHYLHLWSLFFRVYIKRIIVFSPSVVWY